MGRLLIINGSPRAAKSNSRKFAEIVENSWPGETDSYWAVSGKHESVCQKLEKYEHIMFIFPLYADTIPAVLIGFLKCFEKAALSENVKIHVIINCGFLEPRQNDTALRTIRYFCEKNHMDFGTALKIGGGEAIMGTPFSFLVKRKIKKTVKMAVMGKSRILSVSMPISKGMFLKASRKYWINYGKRFHVTEEQMRTMKIEDM